MLSLLVSSGDPVADRRLKWADALFAEGDAAGAASILDEALTGLPGWAAGWFRLGELYEAAGADAEAVRAWDQALIADPADHLGAALRRALAAGRLPQPAPSGNVLPFDRGGSAAPAAAGAAGLAQMPSAFVETLFDAYAGEFDQSLARLDYRGPQIVAAEVARHGQAGRALDLGCGTGLLGVELRPLVSYLAGCDISARMLAQAQERGIYDQLDKRDLTDMPPEPQAWDLIAAADVVMYIGGLETLLDWISQALVPGGRLVFTAESMPGTGYALAETRRYRHSADYLTRSLTAAGFDSPELMPIVVRHDRGEPVTAWLISARLGEGVTAGTPGAGSAAGADGLGEPTAA